MSLEVYIILSRNLHTSNKTNNEEQGRSQLNEILIKNYNTIFVGLCINKVSRILIGPIQKRVSSLFLVWRHRFWYHGLESIFF